MGIERPEGPYALEMTAGAAWVWADEDSYFSRADELTDTLAQLTGAREDWEHHRKSLFGDGGSWSGEAATAAAAEIDAHTDSMHTLQGHLRTATDQASRTGNAIVDAKTAVIANVVQAQTIIDQINALDTDEDMTGLIQQVVLATYTNNTAVVASAAAGLQPPAVTQAASGDKAMKAMGARGAGKAVAARAGSTDVKRAPVEPKTDDKGQEGRGQEGKGDKGKGGGQGGGQGGSQGGKEKKKVGAVTIEKKDGKFGKERSASFGKSGTTKITTTGDLIKQWGSPTGRHDMKPPATGKYQVNMGSGEWERYGPGRQGEAWVRRTDDGITGKAGVSAWVAKGKGTFATEIGGRPLTVEGNYLVGAKAESSFALTDHGVSLGAETFVGAQADTVGKYKIGPFELSLGASAQLGVGAGAHVDAGIQDGKAVFGGEIGAAFGLGGKISPHIEVDYKALIDGLSHADDWLEGLFD